MDPLLLAVCALAALLAAVLSALALRAAARAGANQELARLLSVVEHAAQGQRTEADTTRAHVTEAERAISNRAEAARTELRVSLNELSASLARDQAESRVLMEQKLREMAESSAARLGQIERAVHEQLHQAVEKQMQASFQRVLDQFAQVQKAMADVQAVSAQVGDLRRVFSNVKARGGWGETHLRTLLEDCLPGSFLLNARIREGTVVEFALPMPMRVQKRPLLAIDSKFPTEDYERMLNAAEAGDAEAERAARAALAKRIESEARKIADKYIYQPVTVEFAVMYLPTDGLYVEAAREPGLLERLSREVKVLVVGPSLAPALLRTIQLGHVTLGIEQKVDQVRELLSVTKGEMAKMDEALEKVGRKAGEFTTAIENARSRTRTVRRKLTSLEAAEAPEEFWLEEPAGS